jgi:hypothetical protein
MEKHRLSQPVTVAIPFYLLLWVAIFNGYPLLYDDTGGYVTNSFTLWQMPYRSIVYSSIFIRLPSLGMSPWVIVLTQS